MTTQGWSGFVIKLKSEAFKTFKEWEVSMEKQTNRKLKRLIIDKA